MSAPSDNHRTIDFPSEVAIIGGGRWSRVYAEVLDEILPAPSALVLCSPSQHQALRSWVQSSSRLSRPVRVTSDLDALLQRPALGAAVVANRTIHHAETAARVLQSGIPALVEKPVAMTLAEARHLYELSQAKQVVLAAGHVFQFASYLSKLAASLSGPTNLAIRWSDPVREVRHGETKSFDYATPIIADVMPHIYAICRHFLPVLPLAVDEVTVRRGGRAVTLRLAAHDITIEASIERLADERHRSIVLETQNEAIQLDFSREPGQVHRSGRTFSGDADWDSEPSPLRRQLAAFFRAVATGRPEHRTHRDDFVDCASLIDAAMASYSHIRREQLTSALRSAVAGRPVPTEARYALREISGSQIEEVQLSGSRDFDLDETLDELWRALSGQHSSAKAEALIAACPELSAIAHSMRR